MPSKTNEQALESAIEKALTGTSQEEQKSKSDSLQEPTAVYQSSKKYRTGNKSDFNAKYALDETLFWEFLETTQEEELNKLKRTPDWKLKILERYDRMVKKYGLLRLLRKGLEVDDANFTLLYQLPLASSSKAVQKNFDRNIFSVTRQVQYNQENAREEIDMVVFINGMPIATLELKNAWTDKPPKYTA